MGRTTQYDSSMMSRTITLALCTMTLVCGMQLSGNWPQQEKDIIVSENASPVHEMASFLHEVEDAFTAHEAECKSFLARNARWLRVPMREGHALLKLFRNPSAVRMEIFVTCPTGVAEEEMIDAPVRGKDLLHFIGTDGNTTGSIFLLPGGAGGAQGS